MNTKYSILPITIASILGLSACGGGGSNDSSPLAPPPPAPAPTSGTLSVDVIGLPDNTNANVTITGPDGFSRNISNSTDLSDLTPGSYQVITNDVLAGSSSFDVQPSTINLQVNANQTTSQTLIYQTNITSIGAISNFGSVFVNGIKFETDDAFIELEDEEADENELKTGMKVKIEGRTTADGSIASAISINYDSDLKGPIESISLSQGSIVVLGQTIVIDRLTNFDNTTFEQLVVGDIVEVSVLEKTDNQFVATHVEIEDENELFELKGKVSNLNTNEATFSIRGVMVDYSQAVVDFNIQENSLVEVKFNQRIENGTIIASLLENEDEDDTTDIDDYLVLKGVIEALDESELTLGSGHQIAIDNDTEVENGSFTDLIPGLTVVVKIETENGQQVADDIWIVNQNETEIRSIITEIDLQDNKIEVLGREFEIGTFTVFVDESSLNVRQMTIQNLAVGDEVEILGVVNSNDDDDLFASRVTRLSVGNGIPVQSSVEIEGRLQSLTDTEISVRGINIKINSATEFYLDEQDSYIDSITFLDLATIGSEVEIDAVKLQNGELLAIEVELDERDDDRDDDSIGGSVKLEGQITEELIDNVFTLNRQQIIINSETRFEDGDIDSLVIGQSLEVRVKETESGLLALYIEIEDENGEHDNDDYEVELKGTISDVNNNSEFIINGISIVVTEQTVFEDGIFANWMVGMLVEVEGNYDAQGRLIARKIDIEGVDDQEIEISGPISSLSESSFMIGNILINIEGNIEFEEGNRSKLADQVFVELDGNFNMEGVFVPRKLEFDDRDDDFDAFEIEGRISSISDTVVEIGVAKIILNDNVRFLGGNRNDLAVGTYVEIDASFDNQNGFIATEVSFGTDD